MVAGCLWDRREPALRTMAGTLPRSNSEHVGEPRRHIPSLFQYGFHCRRGLKLTAPAVVRWPCIRRQAGIIKLDSLMLGKALLSHQMMNISRKFAALLAIPFLFAGLAHAQTI